MYNKNMKLAFGYKMGVGKDTAVEYLQQKYGGEKLSFAAPLYDILHYAQDRCGFARKKDRQFLQYIGTEWGRVQEQNVWVRLAVEATPKQGNVYMSDVRFLNEFQAMKDNGWKCVKLVREHQENRKGSGSHSHRSETELDALDDDEWDYIVHNNDKLEDFYENLDRIAVENGMQALNE